MDQAAIDPGAILTPVDDGEAGIVVVARAIWRRRRILGITIPAALVLATLYLYGREPVYQASAVIYPSSATETQTRRITPTGSSALGILDVVNRGAPTPFDEFFAIMKTPEFATEMDQRLDLAKHLYARSWDEAGHRWKLPEGPGTWMKRLLGWQIYPFDPIAALTDFFGKSLVIVQPDKRVLLMTITFSARDREFAQTILSTALDTTRQILIKQRDEELAHDIDYLTARLQTIDLVEHRVQLGQLLADQEREMMLLKAGSYGADVLQPAYTPSNPHYPNVRVTLLLAFGIGLISGSSIALALALRET